MHSVQVMRNNKRASEFKADMKDIQTSARSCYQMGTASPVLAPLRTWEPCVACSSLFCLAPLCDAARSECVIQVSLPPGRAERKKMLLRDSCFCSKLRDFEATLARFTI
jgi:hypothetical protein